MKTKYILHGGYVTRENELNEKFFSEIGNTLNDGETILMCYFAPSVGNNKTEQEKYELGIDFFSKKIADKNLNFVFAKRDNFIEDLRKADALYIHGGKTDELFNDLKKYPNFIDEVKKKKVVIGSSAGAYVLAKYSIDYPDRSEAKKRFGILPIKIFCHFEESRRKTIESKFAKVDKDNKFELVLLEDCETRVIIQ